MIRPDLHTRDEGHQKWHRVPREIPILPENQRDGERNKEWVREGEKRANVYRKSIEGCFGRAA